MSDTNLKVLVCVLVLLTTIGAITAVQAVEPGELRWQEVFPEVNPQFGTGLPAIADDGTIYYAAQPDTGENHVTLHAFNPDGSIKWTNQYSPVPDSSQADITTAIPTIGPGGTIHVPGVTSDQTPALHAFNPNGTLKWSFTYKDPSPIPLQSVGPSGTVYLQNGPRTTALNPDGSIKWSKDDANFGKITIDDDGNLYYFKPENNNSLSLESRTPTNEKRWEYELDPTVTPVTYTTGIQPLIGENSIYVPTESKIIAVGKNGKHKWTHSKNSTLQLPVQNPILNETGILYVNQKTESEYLLHQLNTEGTLQFSTALPITNQPDNPSTSSLPLFHMGAGENGTTYVLAQLGPDAGSELLAISPDDGLKWSKQADVLANLGIFTPFKIKDNSLYLSAAINGGKIALRTFATTSDRPAKGPWTVPLTADNQNTFRQRFGQSCELSPRTSLFPGYISLSRGAVFLFINGFEDSDVSVTDVDASSVTVAGAEPEWHFTLPPFFSNSGFMILNYDADNLTVDENSLDPTGFTEIELPIEGELKDDGCFKSEETVNVRP